MKPTNQQRVMHYAHILYKTGEYSWSDALKIAWTIHYLRHYLNRGIVRFTYVKRNGELREARGTRCPELIPPSRTPSGVQQREVEQGLRQPDYSSIAYFDLDKEAWRAFDIRMFVEAKGVAVVSTLCG